MREILNFNYIFLHCSHYYCCVHTEKIVPDKLYVIIGMHMAKQTCQNINTNVDTGKLQLGNPFTDADIGQ